jgi:hypothetical protein
MSGNFVALMHFMEPKADLRIYNSPLPLPILSQIGTVYAPIEHLEGPF